MVKSYGPFSSSSSDVQSEWASSDERVGGFGFGRVGIGALGTVGIGSPSSAREGGFGLGRVGMGALGTVGIGSPTVLAVGVLAVILIVGLRCRVVCGF